MWKDIWTGGGRDERLTNPWWSENPEKLIYAGG